MIDMGWKRLCRPGVTTWGRELTDAFMERVAQTHNPNSWPVPIILGHLGNKELEERAKISAGSIPAIGQVMGVKYDIGERRFYGHIYLTDDGYTEARSGRWPGVSVNIQKLSRNDFPSPNPVDEYKVPVLCSLALVGANNQGIDGTDPTETWFTDLSPAEYEQLAAEDKEEKITKLYYTTPLAGWKLEEGIMKKNVMLSADGSDGGGGSPAGDGSGGEVSVLQDAMLTAAPSIATAMFDALTAGDTAGAQTQFDELCKALEGLGINCKPDVVETLPAAGADAPVLDPAQTATLEAAKAAAEKLQLENGKLRGENDTLKLEGVLGGLTEWFDPAAMGIFRNQLKRGVKLEAVLDNINTTKVAMGQPRYPTKPLPIAGASPTVKRLNKPEDYEDADEFALEADFKRRGGIILEGKPFDPERYRKSMLEHPELIASKAGGGK